MHTTTARLLTARLLPIFLATTVLATAGCSEEAETFPDALLGTWTKESGAIAQLSFSSGGRVDIVLQDGTACSGDYGGNSSDTNATVESGYIDCPGLMDGYATTEFRLSDGDLVGDGTWGGRYNRD